jgi:hypothetical protein
MLFKDITLFVIKSTLVGHFIALGLNHKYATILKKLARKKHSSLFCRSVSDEDEKLYKIAVRIPQHLGLSQKPAH